MKIDDAKTTIVNAWDAAWTAVQPTVPYVLDNEQFAEPNPPSAWVRFSIRHTTGDVMSQGSPARFRRKGNLMVQVFSPIDAGTNAMDVLVKNVIDAIEKQEWGSVPVDPVNTQGASPREQPADGQWAITLIVCPFEYWESK